MITMMTLNSTDQSNITDSETAIENKEPTAIIFIFFSFTLGGKHHGVCMCMCVFVSVRGCACACVHFLASYDDLSEDFSC